MKWRRLGIRVFLIWLMLEALALLLAMSFGIGWVQDLGKPSLEERERIAREIVEGR